MHGVQIEGRLVSSWLGCVQVVVLEDQDVVAALSAEWNSLVGSADVEDDGGGDSLNTDRGAVSL